MKMKILNIVLAGLSIIGLGVHSASAASYTLNTPNSDISTYGSSFGTVSVSLVNPNTAQITFTAGSFGAYHFLFGDGGSVALNVNGAVTYGGYSSITQPQTQGGAPQTPTFTQSSGNEDGFGNFNFQLNNVDGYQHAVSAITFTIDLNSGTWASDADVLTPNANLDVVGAHIFVVNADGTWSNTGFTGYAAGSTPPVPDGGSTVALLGCALAGIGAVGRHFRKR